MKEGTYHDQFLKTFDEFGDAIFRFCIVKTSDPVLAEDLTQETFMRYWQALRAEKTMTNTRSFLYTIARNLVIDWYRKKKTDSLEQKLDEGLQVADTAVSTEFAAEHREILRALDTLDAHDAEVLTLRFVEGLEPRDIAEIVGESANTVSVRINRAVKRLQIKMHV